MGPLRKVTTRPRRHRLGASSGTFGLIEWEHVRAARDLHGAIQRRRPGAGVFITLPATRVARRRNKTEGERE